MRTNDFRGLVALVALFACGTVLAGSKADIVVMTQNQYLGAELTPIIAADDAATANAAMIAALTTLSNNNYPERVEALAESIRDKQPHLVALQEVYAFQCLNPYGTEVPFGQDACELFPNAFNDHLAETMAALGDEYEVAAVVQNLTLAPPALPIPGIPLVLDQAQMPVFIQVIDRDVILARADVDTTVVAFDCGLKPSVNGCNYDNVAPASVGPFDFNVERGFVGVDTTIDGVDYRFINTHLEVKILGDSLPSALLQPAQASELWGAILGTFDPSKRLIVAGDFNSSPVDISPAGVVTAYQQLTTGQSIFGDRLPFSLTDTWYLRPGNPDGFTCCELADLSNAPSQHYERIDHVFTLPSPSQVKANVLDAEVKDKTLSGLWPSDHASVSAELTY
jgi:endonuclease/exonuclease/phosphatase family metal-dependent hydrolase